MITVKGRALIIPNEERQIGTTYDNNAEVRRFRIGRLTSGGIDISNLTYKLDLEYAGQIKDTSLLTKEITEDSIVLDWTVPAACVAAPGTVWIAIRGFDNYGTVKWATNKGTVYVFETVNTPGTYTGNLTELEQLESSITEKMVSLNQNESIRQQQESERQINTQAAIDRANSAATGLDEAINRANNAAVGVEGAIDRVNDAAIGVEEATLAANNAASSVSDVKDQAISAAQAANNAASSVSEVKDQAISAVQAANTAAAGAIGAKDQAISAAQVANTAAVGAIGAKDQAAAAAQTANTAAVGATGAKDQAEAAAQAANTAAADITDAKNQTISAAQAANTAAAGATGAKNEAETATQAAETAAINAEHNSVFAKEQGDYAKEQGDAAKAALLGDLSEKTIDIFTPSTEAFPIPEQGEKLSVIFGKLLKSMTDWFTLKSEILLKSMIVNHFAQTEAGGVADARLVKILNDRIGNTSNLPSGTTDLVNAIAQANSNLTDFRDQYRKAISLPDDTDINTLISPGTYNVYTTIDSKKYRWIVVVDWCDASSVGLSRQTAYYYLGSGPMAPITRYQYNTGSGYAWSQWYYMDYHARINLTTGYISGMVNDKISQGYKGGDIALGSYAPPDTYSGNQYGTIKWTVVFSDIAYLQFLVPRSTAIITRAISASESYDTGWVVH